MFSNKKAYHNHDVIDEIIASMEILYEGSKEITPTDVLRMAKLDENNTTRRLVVDIAINLSLGIKSSGKGIKIVDTREFE